MEQVAAADDESPLAGVRRSPRGEGNSRDWEEVASALLEEGLVLTALELHAELLESGKEVASLRDYFSNPGNFESAIPQPPSALLGSDLVRTSSMSTFDSIELGRFSDDSNRDADDRVAVLEFELRKAHETIKSLRGSLTEATEVRPSKGKKTANLVKSDEPIKLHEKRALNFLGHEYFMQQGDKLTAITLTEENGDQDFDDWDDVGLNIPKPPDLLYLFRNYSTFMLSDREKLERIKNLEDQLSTATGQNLALRRENEALHVRMRRSSMISAKGELERQDSLHHSHRRSSSFSDRPPLPAAAATTEPSAVVGGAVLRRRSLNRSSPEVDLAGKKTSSPQKVSSQARRNSLTTRRVSREDNDETLSTQSRGELTRSMTSSTSAVSTRSDATLVHEDDTETVVDETERGRGFSIADSVDTGEEGWRSRQNTLTEKTDKESGETQGTKENGERKGEGGEGEGEKEFRDTEAEGSNPDKDAEMEEEGEGKGNVCERHMSVVFRQELLNTVHLKIDSRIGLEIAKLSDSKCDIVQLMGRCLPHIVPNVILAKREELIPVLLIVIASHPDSKMRDQLLHTMFNLIKRPDRHQRQMIMNGCVEYAKLSGSTRVESELLPQMWEQITHKYYERRLLVAESCGVLAPYIPPELRGSLVLSMLNQMLTEDKAESVRQAVCRSLAVLVAFTDDSDKFKQSWELLLKVLRDHSQLVVSTAYSVLLPALAAWAFELDSLESDMLSYFLHQMVTCIKQVSKSESASGAVEQSYHHVLTLTHLVPWHYASMLLTGPFSSDTTAASIKPVSFPHPSSPLLDIQVIVGDDDKLASLVNSFESAVSAESFTAWPVLDWFTKEYLGKLLRAAVTLDFSQADLVHSLSVLVSTYCTYLGYTFTHKVICPIFEKNLSLPKQNASSVLAEGRSYITSPVLPMYVAGVLASFPKDEKLLLTYLRGVTVDLALYFAPIEGLLASLRELKRNRRYHTPLLGMLHDLSTHSSFPVRRYTATLLGVMVRGVEEKLVMSTVVPQLVHLARDTEINVRIETISSFGIIMQAVTSKDILVRVHEQFEWFMSHDQHRTDHQVLMALLKTLASIGPHADPVFRDEFIIPRLHRVAVDNNLASNLTRRRDVALVLLDCYKNISECFISVSLLESAMLPGLASLREDLEASQPDKVPAVKQLMQNSRSKIEEYRRKGQAAESQEVKSGTFFSKLMPPFNQDSVSPSKFFKKKS